MLVAFIQRAVVQGIPLLFGSTGEILTEKSGNLNLGTAGVMYVGGITGVIGAFLYEQNATQMNTFLTVLIPILSSILGSLVMGLIYSFLTVTLRANQNVTGLALTTFGVGFGNFFGGSLIKLTKSDVPSVTLTATSLAFKKALPFASKLGWFGEIFLSYSFLAYVAIAIAIIVSFYFNRTRSGLNLRAVGENPATADAAGINVGACYLRYLETEPQHNRFYSFRRTLYCPQLYSESEHERSGAFQDDSVPRYNHCSYCYQHAQEERIPAAAESGTFIFPLGPLST